MKKDGRLVFIDLVPRKLLALHRLLKGGIDLFGCSGLKGNIVEALVGSAAAMGFEVFDPFVKSGAYLGDASKAFLSDALCKLFDIIGKARFT